MARRGERVKLSVERVVEAGTAIAVREGVGALTMRAVAEACGAAPMSLYRHVRGKDELVELVVDRLLEGVAGGTYRGDWREKLTALHGGFRQALLGDAGVGRVFSDRFVSGPNQTRILERVLGFLIEGGFRGPDVVIAADALFVYVLGAVCHDVTRPPAEWHRHLGHVEGSDTPHLLEHVRYLAKREADVMFAAGYAAVLAGLESLLLRDTEEGGQAV